MKSGTVFSKACWVMLHLGPAELFKRARRYFRGYNFKWLWVYRKQTNVYRAWLKKEAEKVEAKLSTAHQDMNKFSYKPLISIVMPVVLNTRTLHLEESVKSVINQAYPFWELCIADAVLPEENVEEILHKYTRADDRIRVVNQHSCGGVINAGEETHSVAAGEFIGILECGDVLAPHTLLEAVRVLNEKPDADVIYSDEDLLTSDGARTSPFFKPDWSPDLLLSMNYISHFFLARSSLLRETGEFRDKAGGCNDYDLALRLTERTTRIFHIPEILYHSRASQYPAPDLQDAKSAGIDSGLKAIEDALNRRGLEGEVLQTGEGHYRAKYKVKGKPLISIIIPVRDKINLLKRCIHSIKDKSTYHNYEIIIIDNGSVEAESLAYFKDIAGMKNYRVISFDEPFNYSRINNFASQQARGDYLLFLNNDTEVISPDWLEEMLSHCQRPETGAVGIKLLFPDNRIQHAGVVVGLRRVAMHAFYGIQHEDRVYMGMTGVIRNYSAVTAACLMMRKKVFDKVGGFDEELAVAYNDVDLCLKVLKKGYYVVWTPYALLYHHESASRGQYYPEDNIHYFCEKWEKFLRQGDPFYNPNLSLNHSDFRIKV